MAGNAVRRLFVAVEVPEEARAQVAEAVAPLRARAPGLAWTDPAGWHLTVVFLGATPVEALPGLRQALGALAAASAAFEVRLDGTAGTFGGGVLWARLGPHPALAALAAGARAALTPFGFDGEDRPYHGHLTLARARRSGGQGPGGARIDRRLAQAYRGPAAAWTLDRLLLLQSRRGSEGARYREEAAWPLGPVA